LLRGYSKASTIVLFLGGLLALATLTIPPTFGFNTQTSSAMASIIGVVLILSGALIAIRIQPAIPRKETY